MNNISTGLIVPEGGRTYRSIALIWDKPADNAERYNIYINGKYAASTKQTCFAACGLEPDTMYSFSVTAETDGGKEEFQCGKINAATSKADMVIDVTKPPYNADSSGKTVCTAAIQHAIDCCPENGIVLIPDGVYVSGALFLHSDMTLEINGMLAGTDEPEDYPLIDSRFEGWELKSRSSLINAGEMTHKAAADGSYIYNCENIAICGRGTVRGGGSKLAQKCMEAAAAENPDITPENALRCRGRLINLSNCKNVNVSGVSLVNPPSWTMHMIYCRGITAHGLSFDSTGVHNGDGWDPDSSENCIIFNSKFRTGDDCIAIKSGKNPEGCEINRPSRNIRIYACEFEGGLGLAVGSEMSGGVDGVYIRGCTMKNTRYGLELKATNGRGGYIRNIYADDCCFDRILAHKVDYNDDGAPSLSRPIFSDMTFKNIKIRGKRTYEKTESVRCSIELDGFDGESIKNAEFINAVLGDEDDSQKSVSLCRCSGITFKNVATYDGGTLSYEIRNGCDKIIIDS